MARKQLQMPWECYVCADCLQSNFYAIWLVKQQCFEPHRHYRRELVPVAIDQSNMALVAIRPLSENYSKIKGKFVMCKSYPGCLAGDGCGYTHSKVEMDTWNAKKSTIKENPTLSDDLGRLCEEVKYSPLPMEVCQLCCETYSSAAWLAKLCCIHPESHATQPKIAVVCSPQSRKLVNVRSPPRSSDLRPRKHLLKLGEICEAGERCTGAHSEEEYSFWVWEAITSTYKAMVAQYGTLSEKYSYPEESSPSLLHAVQTATTRNNYVSKYHKLVYLDELANSRKMTKECDGTVTIQVPMESQTAHITRMRSSAAMDFAHHNRAEIAIRIGSHFYHSTAVDRDYDADALVIKVRSFTFLEYYSGRCLENINVHFDISHLYFHRLHEAISYAESETILDKLLPTKQSFTAGPKPSLRFVRNFRIDREYQLKALNQMLSCNPRAPYLVLGPFGTGKSHVLAAAVASLLTNPSNKVLLCTHLNRGADGLYKMLQKQLGYQVTASYVVRLVPNQDALGQLRLKQPYFALAAKTATASQLARIPVILSTFIAAMHIRDREREEGVILGFTHILIDEGAQSREPEVLGALSLADASTRVVIVGDNKQVGPQVEVLSNAARENGLGTSIVERLFTHYKMLKRNKAPQTHVSTLLTNYRCHPSILMLASSLHYEFTLLSRSKSQAHSRAPFPIIFACSSLEIGDFRDLPAVNEAEADTLIARMVEFIQDWPSDGPIPTFGLLASTRQQVVCLRKKFYRIRNSRRLRSNVEILPTYNIQGEEFDAVFLSTAEPTDSHGEPPSPSKSICNDYVFNTVLTRARSLIYSIGNPFLLQRKGSSKHFKVNCWQEYIRRCIQCQTLILPEVNSEEDARGMPQLVDQLTSKVFLAEALEQATTVDMGEEDLDIIVEQYIDDLQKRREYHISHKLVQDPRGEIGWAEVAERAESEDAVPEGEVVWCTLDCKSHRFAHAVPKDPSKPHIKIEGLHDRRLAFHGDVVKVDVVRQCVLLDNETEEAICKTHFGTAFLCRIDPYNPSRFFPLDKRHPKFVNLPTLTHKEKEGVVCFDPKSINSCPKMSNFIPTECALKMLFIVKFLGWHKKYPYPLGIIVSAMPPGYSLGTGEMVLRVSHGIPLTPSQLPSTHPQLQPPERGSLIFNNAFTIDPEGSTDHDDALTCRLIRKESNGSARYEVGVHITNVPKYVPKGSQVDEIALQRGCSVYRAPDKCISMMLPPEISDATNVAKGKLTDTFSVVALVDINQEAAVAKLHNCNILETQVVSALELTYPEAQSIIFSQSKSQSLKNRLLRYDHSQTPTTSQLSIKTKLKILWNVAYFLRQQRLGVGSSSFLISEPEKEECPEAHNLIQEFMIWANQKVAKKLLRSFPECTILRRQGRPNAEQLQSLVKHSGSNMALSPALQFYVPEEVVPSSIVVLLQDTVNQIDRYVRSGDVTDVVKALHLIQHEHLHPQIVAAHDNFRRQAQSSTEYCVSTARQHDYWHDTLRCNEYTHFTSPIRRYIDIVIQRFLHAALSAESSPPHSHSELEGIALHVQDRLRKGNRYERDIKKLTFAHGLLSSGREFLCFVVEINKGKMHIRFRDLSLKIFYTEELPIYLRNLDAFDIRAQKKPVSAAMPGRQPSPAEPPQVFTWRVKVSSFTGRAQTFLSHPHLLFTPQPSTERKAEITLFFSDEDGELKSSDWRQEPPLLADIKPLTCPIPLREWKRVQECLRQNPSNPDTRAASRALQQLTMCNTTATSGRQSATIPNALCPLWICKFQRPVHPCEVMQVQLSATRSSSIVSPCVQLLEVGPGLSICVQHNATPAECFTDKPTENASKKEYHDRFEYFRRWEQVLLAEGAFSSLVDAELLLIKDVELKWPSLTSQVSSDGQLYYQLPMRKDVRDEGVQMELPRQFEESSFNFFNFFAGDLLCIRYQNTDKSASGDLRHVFHMVVSHIRYEPHQPVTIYLIFVGKSSNYIPAAMERALKNPALLQCEVQLVPLSLPFRRVYRSLCQLNQGEFTGMAESIALGSARTADHSPPPIIAEAASKATSLWPIRRRTHGSGLMKLNRFQKEAIQLACSNRNKFVMIQGPPGTGKSVTGAHLAYTLAVKLRSQGTRSKREGDKFEEDKDLQPCVMYCGPSQQSVNVVLEILLKEPSVSSELKIIRVYSKAVEGKDFVGPKSNTELFRKQRTDAKCDAKYQDYALHYLIRKKNPQIQALDAEFERLHRANKIASQVKRSRYRTIVKKTEVEVLKNGVDIILCTCNEASSHRVMDSLRPVYCIIDECAMATEPECMVPIRRAEHVILIGDHQQLQPVIQYREAAEMGLKRSLFERYVLGIGHQPHMLRKQYRMHVELCRFPSLEFYNGDLQTDFSVKIRPNKEAHLRGFWPRGKQKPFAFCDVVGTVGESHTGQKGTARVGVESKYNVKEAEKIAQIAKKLVGTHGIHPDRIAAITPYSAQREEIRKQLQTQSLSAVLVKTITESQGSEYGIVLMSTVRSKPLREITTTNGKKKKADLGWLRENLGFITDRHQICVGITRCKYGLVIVGNKTLLSYDTTWNRLIEHYQRNGCVRTERNFP